MPGRCSTCGATDPLANSFCSNGYHAPVVQPLVEEAIQQAKSNPVPLAVLAASMVLVKRMGRDASRESHGGR